MQVRRVFCEVAVLRNEIVRRIDNVPIVIDVRRGVGRREEIVLRSTRKRKDAVKWNNIGGVAGSRACTRSE